MEQENRRSDSDLKLAQLVRADFSSRKEFRPCTLVDKLGSLVILEKDCSQLEERIPGSDYHLIRDLHTGEVAGIRIGNWTKYSKR